MLLCFILPHIITFCDGKADCTDVVQRFQQFLNFKPITTCRLNENKIYENQKSCCPQQVVFHKVDYSKAAVYKCKLAVYKCKPVDYSKVAVYKCKLVVYKCKVAVYKSKPVVYTCKVLNSRFTTVLLITLLDTVEVTSFFQIFFCKAVVYMCKPVVDRCKLLLYCKPPLYKL